MEPKILYFKGARRVCGIERWWRRVPGELKEWYGGRWVSTDGGRWTTADEPISGRVMWVPERGDMLFVVRECWAPSLGLQTYYLLRRRNGERVYIECRDDRHGRSCVTVHEPGTVPADI